MAKLGSGHRQIQAVIDERQRRTDKFIKGTGKALKKSVKAFKGTGILSAVGNSIIWIFKAIFILTWFVLKLMILFWYILILYAYKAIAFLVQNLISATKNSRKKVYTSDFILEDDKKE